MDGESTHEAEGIGTEPCILKPGAVRTPYFALHRHCTSQVWELARWKVPGTGILGL